VSSKNLCKLINLQQLANVNVTDILLDGHSSAKSRNVTSLGVVINAELTFATHVKWVASRCFYQLGQLWSGRSTLPVDNAKLLAHAFITSRVAYCNSILYWTAVIHLRPLQLVLNTAACLVKKRKWDRLSHYSSGERKHNVILLNVNC